MQTKFAQDFFASKLRDLSLSEFQLEACATPHRLVVLVSNLPNMVRIASVTTKGPLLSAPESAILGFCSKYKITKDDLLIESGYYVYKTEAQEISVQNLIPQLINAFFADLCQKYTKRMKWNSSGQEWIRPIRRITCIFGASLVRVTYAGVNSTNSIIGNELISQNLISINSISSYKNALQTSYVMLNLDSRMQVIASELKFLEDQCKLSRVAGEKLIEEVACLCEYPKIVVGTFDAKYLNLPDKILISTIEKNQKYFLFYDDVGSLSNKFAICVNGKYSPEVEMDILKGNLSVLNARLEDAIYYIKRDSARKLESRLDDLKKIIFHKSAGTIYDRVMRMQKIADSYSQNNMIAPFLPNIKTAISLIKCDLSTELVESFPNLQGYIGGVYAKIDGYSPDVIEAITNQYKPAFEGDSVSRGVTSQMVCLIEKFEKTSSLLSAGEVPTSSKDPFAIRRDIFGIVRIIIECELNVDLVCTRAFSDILFERTTKYLSKTIPENIVSAIFDVHKNDEQVNLLKMYQKCVTVNENIDKFSSFKRLHNFVSKLTRSDNFVDIDESLLSSGVEDFLFQGSCMEFDALDDLFKIDDILNSFFDNVMVNVEDVAIKQNRLALLMKIHKISSKFINLNIMLNSAK